MFALEQDVVDKVVAALPDPVVRMLRMSGLYLAGGFIRSVVEGEKPQDIDIFGSSKEELLRYAKLLSGKGRETKNAFTVSLPNSPQVQFIFRWVFENPEKVIESFDFTIAQAVVWFDKGEDRWEGLRAYYFILDIQDKILRYTSPIRNEDAAGSLLRVRKFLKRGYDISDLDLGKVVARITKKVVEEKKEIETEASFGLLVDSVARSIPSVEDLTVREMDRARRVGGDSV